MIPRTISVLPFSTYQLGHLDTSLLVNMNVNLKAAWPCQCQDLKTNSHSHVPGDNEGSIGSYNQGLIELFVGKQHHMYYICIVR